MINFAILAWLGKVKERVKILWIALWANILINIILLYIIKTGLPWAVIAMIIGWIILRWWSLKIIQKNIKISFDWIFFIKNLGIICICSSIFFLMKNNYFVINDIARRDNIKYLMIIIIFYYLVLAAINYKSIKQLIKEIKKIKN